MVVPMKDSVLCTSPYCGSPLMELNFVSAPPPPPPHTHTHNPKSPYPQQTLLTDRKIKLMVTSTLVSLSWISVRHLSGSLRLSTIAEWPPKKKKKVPSLWEMINSVISPTVPPKHHRDTVFRWWAVRNVATIEHGKNASSALVYWCQRHPASTILLWPVHFVTKW
jgi:hypothetical protein